MVPGIDLGTASRESILPFTCASLGLPFTGSSFLTLAVTMDKRMAKAVAAANGVPIPRTFTDTDQAIARIRYPCIVKPAAEGSSMGIDDASVAMNRKQLEQAIARVRERYGTAWMIEEFVRGPELALGVLGNHVLDPVSVNLEKMPGSPLVRSHRVKHGEIDYVERPSLPADRLVELKRLAWRAHVALGARHYNRMEFIDDGRRFWLIEMNPLPDISATESFLAIAASSWGIDFDHMISLVLWNAVEDYRRQPGFAACFSDARIAPLRRFIEPGLAALQKHLDGPTLASASAGGRGAHRLAGQEKSARGAVAGRTSMSSERSERAAARSAAPRGR
jgi:D-alanine-D-alanine ligase